MRLMRAKTFSERYFDPADAPDERTVRGWVECGSVPGKLVALGTRTMTYIDADAWEERTGNALADRIITA